MAERINVRRMNRELDALEARVRNWPLQEARPRPPERPPVDPHPRRPSNTGPGLETLKWVVGREGHTHSNELRRAAMEEVLRRHDVTKIGDEETKKLAEQLCISSEQWNFPKKAKFFTLKTLVVAGAIGLGALLGNLGGGAALAARTGTVLGAGYLNAWLTKRQLSGRLVSREEKIGRATRSGVMTWIAVAAGMLAYAGVTSATKLSGTSAWENIQELAKWLFQ